MNILNEYTKMVTHTAGYENLYNVLLSLHFYIENMGKILCEVLTCGKAS